MKNKGDGMKSIAMVMVLILAGLTAPGVQAEIYSWTDENGVKHYSHTPPPDQSGPVKTAPEIQPSPTQNPKTAFPPGAHRSRKGKIGRQDRLVRTTPTGGVYEYAQQAGHYRTLSISDAAAAVESR
jgi:hypothetical protein